MKTENQEYTNLKNQEYTQNILALCEYSQSIQEICNPLFQKFGLTNFNYYILYDNKRRLHLNSNPEWLKHYYEKKYYNTARSDLSPKLYKDGCGLWDSWSEDDIGSKTIKLDAAENFNIAHGLMLTKRLKDSSLVFEFSTNKDNVGINNLYMSNLDIFENFTYFFQKKAETIIKLASLHIFKLEKDFDRIPVGETYANKILLSQQEIFSKYQNGGFVYQPLTKKELECIDWLAKGKTALEIGLILNISRRTVEKHITHIKEKLGCYSLYQLGKKVNKLGLERFLSDC